MTFLVGLLAFSLAAMAFFAGMFYAKMKAAQVHEKAERQEVRNLSEWIRDAQARQED